MTGKCPKCEAIIREVRLEGVSIKERSSRGNSWHGVSYLCPICDTVLSVAIDPIALMNDTVQKVLLALKQQG